MKHLLAVLVLLTDAHEKLLGVELPVVGKHA